MKKYFDTKSFTEGASFKDVDSKKGIVTGYLSSFDTTDADNDVIVKGAFTKTIQENGPDSSSPRIKYLLNHQSTQGLGKFLTLKEDSHGLYYEAQVGSHALGQDFIKQVESGVITEHSIGFKTILDQKGQGVTYLKEIKLMEGSALTGWGSNQNTPIISIKSFDLVTSAVEKLDLIRKSYKDNQTDDTLDLIDLQIKQLQQFFIDHNATQAANAPGPEIDEGVMKELVSINKFLKKVK